MSFSRITARLTVDENVRKQVVSDLQVLFDSFAIQRIAVYDSDITCVTVYAVEDADQVRRETEQI